MTMVWAKAHLVFTIGQNLRVRWVMLQNRNRIHSAESSADIMFTQNATLRGVVSELCEEVRREHKERRTGRVTHLELVSRGNELRAIPKACRGLHRHAVGECRNGKGEPTRKGCSPICTVSCENYAV